MNFHMLYAWHRAPHNALARAIPAILASITRLEPAPPIVARFAHRHTEDPVPFTTVPDATQRFETNHACLFRAGPDPDRPEVEFVLTPVGWTQQFEHDPSWAESGGLTAHLNGTRWSVAHIRSLFADLLALPHLETMNVSSGPLRGVLHRRPDLRTVDFDRAYAAVHGLGLLRFFDARLTRLLGLARLPKELQDTLYITIRSDDSAILSTPGDGDFDPHNPTHMHWLETLVARFPQLHPRRPERPPEGT